MRRYIALALILCGFTLVAWGSRSAPVPANAVKSVKIIDDQGRTRLVIESKGGTLEIR
jgi:hypothetical protein